MFDLRAECSLGLRTRTRGSKNERAEGVEWVGLTTRGGDAMGRGQCWGGAPFPDPLFKARGTTLCPQIKGQNHSSGFKAAGKGGVGGWWLGCGTPPRPTGTRGTVPCPQTKGQNLGDSIRRARAALPPCAVPAGSQQEDLPAAPQAIKSADRH